MITPVFHSAILGSGSRVVPSTHNEGYVDCLHTNHQFREKKITSNTEGLHVLSR